MSRSLAAKSASIPSILITNFTFDAVYSYLATPLLDAPTQPLIGTLSPSPSSSSTTTSDQLFPNEPIPADILAPLVSQLHDGYQHADLLLRLPAHIPIPSFLSHPPLPSSDWVDSVSNRFYPSIESHQLSLVDLDILLLPPKPFPNNFIVPRSVRSAPLLVRPPSPDIYTSHGRTEFLLRTGLPNFEGMKILVVSFGGQAFKRPGTSRTNSRVQSRFPSQEALALTADFEASADNKKPSGKRTSRDCSRTMSPSLDKWVLKPKNMNVPVPLDLNAIDRDLGAHIKSKSLDPAKRYRFGSQDHFDENQASSDVDNGISQLESDHELSDLTLPPGNTAVAPASVFANQTKRRHTLPRRRHYNYDLGLRGWLAMTSRLFVPGALPATKSAQTTPQSASLKKSHGKHSNLEVGEVPKMCVIPPTPRSNGSGDIISDNEDTILTSPTSSYSDSEISQTASPLTSAHSSDTANTEIEGQDGVGLLPDKNWIAVICGVSKEQWDAENEDDGLPEGFYVAPKDVYMPDLVAVSDVVLGKLVRNPFFLPSFRLSELFSGLWHDFRVCRWLYSLRLWYVIFLASILNLSIERPFFVVSRPLFIEEHGLRMYLDQEGVGVELSRASYEGGEWAKSIQEAYCKGREMKETKRKKEYEFCMLLKQLDQEGVESDDDRRLSERERQGRDMARDVVEWVENVKMSMNY